MKRALDAAGSSLTSFFHSIRFRLTLWFVLILAVVLAVFSVYIYLSQARDLQFDAAARMRDKFVHVQDYLQRAQWDPADLSAGTVPGSTEPLQKGDVLILADITGSVLQQWGQQISASDPMWKALPDIGSQHPDGSIFEHRASVIGQNEQPVPTDYLFVMTPVVRGGQLLGFLVLGSKSDLAVQSRRLTVSLAVGSLAMLAMAFLGGLWLADRAMRPVSQIALAAREISEGDLDRRIHLRGRDELARLAQTFDDMIGRLQAALNRQRRFTADASHELRTPLTIINLEAGRALSSRRTSEEYRRALEIVEAEGGRMARLVNDLMTLARMDMGEAILKLEELDLGEVAREAVERLQPLAAERSVKLGAGDLDSLCIRGDRQYLLQMASNLLENGIKYAGSGQSVRIEVRHEDGRALVRVSDTGPGIPVEHLPLLFDRFYRVDAARSQNGVDPTSPSGSGLGLSIVAWIVKVHGGTIHVDSKINAGTTVEVTFPLLEVPQSRS